MSDLRPQTYGGTIQVKCLTAHNHHRRVHQVGPLEWDDNCHATAQQWAEQLAREAGSAGGGNSGGLRHGGMGKGMGQNLWWSADETATPQDAVDAWMREASQYNYADPSKAGHFTQVVWRNTLRVGLGVAVIPRPQDASATDDATAGNKHRYGTFVVANYYPHGNTKGKFQENVFEAQVVLDILQEEATTGKSIFDSSKPNEDFTTEIATYAKKKNVQQYDKTKFRENFSPERANDDKIKERKPDERVVQHFNAPSAPVAAVEPQQQASNQLEMIRSQASAPATSVPPPGSATAAGWNYKGPPFWGMTTKVTGADSKLLVENMHTHGPAERGGLRIGDNITHLNGKPTDNNYKQLLMLMMGIVPNPNKDSTVNIGGIGHPVEVTVLRRTEEGGSQDTAGAEEEHTLTVFPMTSKRDNCQWTGADGESTDSPPYFYDTKQADNFQYKSSEEKQEMEADVRASVGADELRQLSEARKEQLVAQEQAHLFVENQKKRQQEEEEEEEERAAKEARQKGELERQELLLSATTAPSLHQGMSDLILPDDHNNTNNGGGSGMSELLLPQKSQQHVREGQEKDKEREALLIANKSTAAGSQSQQPPRMMNDMMSNNNNLPSNASAAPVTATTTAGIGAIPPIHATEADKAMLNRLRRFYEFYAPGEKDDTFLWPERVERFRGNYDDMWTFLENKYGPESRAYNSGGKDNNNNNNNNIVGNGTGPYGQHHQRLPVWQQQDTVRQQQPVSASANDQLYQHPQQHSRMFENAHLLDRPHQHGSSSNDNQLMDLHMQQQQKYNHQYNKTNNNTSHFLGRSYVPHMGYKQPQAVQPQQQQQAGPPVLGMALLNADQNNTNNHTNKAYMNRYQTIDIDPLSANYIFQGSRRSPSSAPNKNFIGSPYVPHLQYNNPAKQQQQQQQRQQQTNQRNQQYNKGNGGGGGGSYRIIPTPGGDGTSVNNNHGRRQQPPLYHNHNNRLHGSGDFGSGGGSRRPSSSPNNTNNYNRNYGGRPPPPPYSASLSGSASSSPAGPAGPVVKTNPLLMKFDASGRGRGGRGRGSNPSGAWRSNYRPPRDGLLQLNNVGDSDDDIYDMDEFDREDLL